MKTITLLRVHCIKPASATNLDAAAWINGFNTWLGLGTAVGSGAAGTAGVYVAVSQMLTSLAAGSYTPGLAVATLANPTTGFVLAAAGGVFAAVSLGTWIASAVDTVREPDQLYIKVNGQRVWPSAEGEPDDVYADNVKEVNHTWPVRNPAFVGRQLLVKMLPAAASIVPSFDEFTHTVELFDYDTYSGDDSLGSVVVKPENPGEFHLIVANPAEDSTYVVDFRVD